MDFDKYKEWLAKLNSNPSATDLKKLGAAIMTDLNSFEYTEIKGRKSPKVPLRFVVLLNEYCRLAEIQKDNDLEVNTYHTTFSVFNERLQGKKQWSGNSEYQDPIEAIVPYTYSPAETETTTVFDQEDINLESITWKNEKQLPEIIDVDYTMLSGPGEKEKARKVNENFLLALGDLSFKSGNFTKALENYSAAAEIDPNHAALFKKSKAEYSLGKRWDAIKTLEGLVNICDIEFKKNPSIDTLNKKIETLEAMNWFGANVLDEILYEINIGLELWNNEPTLLRRKSAYLTNKNEHTRAMNILDTLQKKASTDNAKLSVLQTKVLAYYRKGDYNSARHTLTSCLQINELETTRNNWYLIPNLLPANKTLELVNNLLVQMPSDSNLLSAKGRGLLRFAADDLLLRTPSTNKRIALYVQALDCFNKSIAQKPDFNQSWDGKTYSLLQLKRFGDAWTAAYDARKTDWRSSQFIADLFHPINTNATHWEERLAVIPWLYTSKDFFETAKDLNLFEDIQLGLVKNQVYAEAEQITLAKMARKSFRKEQTTQLAVQRTQELIAQLAYTAYNSGWSARNNKLLITETARNISHIYSRIKYLQDNVWFEQPKYFNKTFSKVCKSDSIKVKQYYNKKLARELDASLYL